MHLEHHIEHAHHHLGCGRRQLRQDLHQRIKCRFGIRQLPCLLANHKAGLALGDVVQKRSIILRLVQLGIVVLVAFVGNSNRQGLGQELFCQAQRDLTFHLPGKQQVVKEFHGQETALLLLGHHRLAAGHIRIATHVVGVYP